MDDFNKRFADAFKKAGFIIRDDETGKEVSDNEFLDYLNQHTVYEIDGSWYTRDSVFSLGSMDFEYASRFKGNTLLAQEIAFYMLNDCRVSGLCIIFAEEKYGIFPLEERTGDQSGIWSCKGYPFIYDDVKVYADWENWDDYGYVAAKKNSVWGVIKVTQFPEPSSEQAAEFQYASPEEAMKSAGIDPLPNNEPFVTKI